MQHNSKPVPIGSKKVIPDATHRTGHSDSQSKQRKQRRQNKHNQYTK